MIEHLRNNGSAYWAVLIAIGVLWFRFTRTDRSLSRADRFRSLLRGNRYDDPSSPSYDPGLPVRQILWVLIGLALVAIALFLVWLLEK